MNIDDTYKVVEMKIGSHMYGTNTPTSDEDFVGIIIPPISAYFGLDNVKEIDCSVVSKLESGKNAPDAIDRKFYEIKNFFKLALDNNPNVVELLMCPTDCLVYTDNNLWNLIRVNNEMFLHQGCKEKFIGYAKGQMHKMTIKLDNYTGLHKFNDWLDEHLANPRTETKTESQFYQNQLLAELRDLKLDFIKFGEHHASVGDIDISLTDKLSKVQSKLKDRLSKVGNRQELYTKYGFDVKFGMHLIRLLVEGIELYQTGNIVMPLEKREMLLDIRNGKYTKEEVIGISEELLAVYNSMTTILPAKPRYHEVQNLLMCILKQHFGIK